MDTPLIQRYFSSHNLTGERAARIEQALGQSHVLNLARHPASPPTTGPVAAHLNPRLEFPIETCRYVVVDVETTGAVPYADKLTEIGAVEVLFQDQQWKLGETFVSLMNPGMKIPPMIQNLTGITDEMVAHAPPEEEVLPEFFRFCGDDVVVGQSVAFDRKFLNMAHRALHNDSMPNIFLCTCKLSRRFFKIEKYNLDILAEYFQLSFDRESDVSCRHRALGDAMVTAKVFVKILESIPHRFSLCHTLKDLLLIQTKSFQPKVYGKFELALDKAPQKPGVYTILDGRGVPVFVRRSRELKNAIRNLFHRKKKDPLIFRIMHRCEEIRWETSETFEDAVSRERDLIDQHHPYFNYA